MADSKATKKAKQAASSLGTGMARSAANSLMGRKKSIDDIVGRMAGPNHRKKRI